MSTPAGTILIADDDRDVVELMKVYIKQLGCRALVAYDGEAALEIAQRELPDIVLLDVLMPRKSGWEVCQALKAVHKTSQICVVLITGKGDVKDRLTGLQIGADDYLVKPLDRADVLERIRKLLNMQCARAETLHDVPTEPAAKRNPLYDRIAGLPSVSAVIDRAKELLIEQSGLGIIFVDIEQFEAMEEEYGWAFFDEFLRRVGEVISADTKNRFEDAIVATQLVGSSSFYIFLKPAESEEDRVEEVAQWIHGNLVEALRERFSSMDAGQIGFFVGATTISYHPQIRLERQIYHGMQKAADAVRNAEQERKRELTRELRDIITRKRVSTLFQPIIRSRDGAIFGYEILTRGPKSSSFRNSDMLFSFAREMRLSWDLEALALESSLKRLRSIDLGERKFLVNLEAEMFELNEFRIHEIVAFFAAHRGRFVFELTERAAIEDYAVFRKLLEDFRGKGIEIALDDVGSGYASLEAIASLAPDYLKITKGLVSAVASEPIKQDLVTMLVELAHKTGAKTIAEGIETQEEYDWCQKLGIDMLQGYFIARPQEEFVMELAAVGGRAR